MNPLLPFLLLLAGAITLVAAARSLDRARRDRRFGALVAIEADGPITLRSERYRLAGRPDELRRGDDGRVLPVELKARRLPPAGPFPSHRVQLAAYCLLVEETTGNPPPFGVLRYADGEVLVPWGAGERAHLLRVMAEANAPYDGRADASPTKCGGCVWSGGCDASRAPGRPTRRRPKAAPVDLGPIR